MLYISYIAGHFVRYVIHYMSKLSRNIIEFLLLNGSKLKANQIQYPPPPPRLTYYQNIWKRQSYPARPFSYKVFYLPAFVVLLNPHPIAY